MRAQEALGTWRCQRATALAEAIETRGPWQADCVVEVDQAASTGTLRAIEVHAALHRPADAAMTSIPTTLDWPHPVKGGHCVLAHYRATCERI